MTETTRQLAAAVTSAVEDHQAARGTNATVLYGSRCRAIDGFYAALLADGLLPTDMEVTDADLIDLASGRVSVDYLVSYR